MLSITTNDEVKSCLHANSSPEDAEYEPITISHGASPNPSPSRAQSAVLQPLPIAFMSGGAMSLAYLEETGPRRDWPPDVESETTAQSTKSSIQDVSTTMLVDTMETVSNHATYHDEDRVPVTESASKPYEDSNVRPLFSPELILSTPSSPTSNPEARSFLIGDSSDDAWPRNTATPPHRASFEEEKTFSPSKWDPLFLTCHNSIRASESREATARLSGLEDIVDALISDNVHPDSWTSNHGLKIHTDFTSDSCSSSGLLHVTLSSIETPSPDLTHPKTFAPIQFSSRILASPTHASRTYNDNNDGSGKSLVQSRPGQLMNEKVDAKTIRKRAFSRRGPKKPQDPPPKRGRPPKLKVDKINHYPEPLAAPERQSSHTKGKFNTNTSPNVKSGLTVTTHLLHLRSKRVARRTLRRSICHPSLLSTSSLQ